MDQRKFLISLLNQTAEIAKIEGKKSPSPENAALLFAINVLNYDKESVSTSDKLVNTLPDKLENRDIPGAFAAVYDEDKEWSEDTTKYAISLLEKEPADNCIHILALTHGFLNGGAVKDYVRESASWLAGTLQACENGAIVFSQLDKNKGEENQSQRN